MYVFSDCSNEGPKYVFFSVAVLMRGQNVCLSLKMLSWEFSLNPIISGALNGVTSGEKGLNIVLQLR